MRDAFRTAINAPVEIKKGFYEGACEAFHKGSPDNIQHILSNPGAFFFDKGQSDSNFVSETLIDLMKNSDKPAAALSDALAKIPKYEGKDILSHTLLYMLQSESPVNKDMVSTLLEAGAEAGFASSISLAVAIKRNAPREIVNLLLEKGANFEAAREIMPHTSDDKSDIVKLDLLKELIETKNELTRVQALVSPALRTAVAPRLNQI